MFQCLYVDVAWKKGRGHDSRTFIRDIHLAKSILEIPPFERKNLFLQLYHDCYMGKFSNYLVLCSKEEAVAPINNVYFSTRIFQAVVGLFSS